MRKTQKKILLASFLFLICYFANLSFASTVINQITGEQTTISGESIIKSKIEAYKEVYHDGEVWNKEVSYDRELILDFDGVEKEYIVSGKGCAAFSLYFQDYLFGSDVTKRFISYLDFDEIKIGDIINYKNAKFEETIENETGYMVRTYEVGNEGHSVVVIDKLSDHIVVAEGNANGTVRYGRKIKFDDLINNADFEGVITCY